MFYDAPDVEYCADYYSQSVSDILSHVLFMSTSNLSFVKTTASPLLELTVAVLAVEMAGILIKKLKITLANNFSCYMFSLFMQSEMTDFGKF